jgi:hypothetical protein
MNSYFYTTVGVVLFFISTSIAQIAIGVPRSDSNVPIDISKIADILIFIVMPVLILLLLIVRLRKGKK